MCRACARSVRPRGTKWLSRSFCSSDVLRQDPVGAYAVMDPESRQLYRKKVAALAARSDFTEIEVAQEALKLAKEAQARNYPDPRISRRESHIGYYLVGEGRDLLQQRISVACHRAAAGPRVALAAIRMSFSLPALPS